MGMQLYITFGELVSWLGGMAVVFIRVKLAPVCDLRVVRDLTNLLVCAIL